MKKQFLHELKPGHQFQWPGDESIYEVITSNETPATFPTSFRILCRVKAESELDDLFGKPGLDPQIFPYPVSAENPVSIIHLDPMEYRHPAAPYGVRSFAETLVCLVTAAGFPQFSERVGELQKRHSVLGGGTLLFDWAVEFETLYGEDKRPNLLGRVSNFLAEKTK